jgi:hypothetical protein
MTVNKLTEIQQIAREGELFFTEHAVRQMLKRAISDVEVQQAIIAGEIIEAYPEDKYSPSYLICGRTHEDRTLHVLCSEPPRVSVITTYEPSPDEWIDSRERKKDE